MAITKTKPQNNPPGMGMLTGALKGFAVGGPVGAAVGAGVGLMGSKNPALGDIADSSAQIAGNSAMSRRMESAAPNPLEPTDAGVENGAPQDKETYLASIDAGLDALHQADLDPAHKLQIAKVLTATKTHAMNGLDYGHLFDQQEEA